MSFEPRSSDRVPTNVTASPSLEVRFFRCDEPFGCFANFSRHAVRVGEHRWPTVEHFYQAQKFSGLNDDWAQAIANARSPKEAAAMGRDRSHPHRPDWESVKDDVMRIGVISKLLDHPEVREMLLATGSAEIIEASPKDSYWGCGADGNGKNMLGKILMEARALFMPQSEVKPEEYVGQLILKTKI